MPDTAAGLPIAPLPSATPSLCDPFPLRPLPTAGPSGCPSIPFGCGGGRQGRERGTTVCFTRDRLRRAAAVGSVWRKGGMTGGRRLPGLQGGLVRMAGGDCRGCKVRLVAWRAAVAGSARWAGRMADGGCRVCKVRLVAWRAAVAGSARWAGRMAGGDCRGCKGESGSGGPSDPLEDHRAAPCDGPQFAWRAPGRRIFRHAVRR